ncbi:ABC-F family ATP-binding cassette domain-containing protein [Candidatus Chromulinivorax destructor]|uniref:ABC transporter ATP-binding protein n=1 Tax=Candidatus Chromulinivorax destructor TaxID=2066483 RepID=A0A345ZC30_9BACT|nr:ABC-F family ATP-binding cassette domain-containing protein [Candidatus Chromulinivorax destructor]AXK60847.1 ABC transporter ATP-binding protein [Candidatus Chromulinivorax destructor]
MIHLKNLSLKYGDQTVFDDLTMMIQDSDRIALVGRNGSGKSTLLKIIAGQQGIDGGQIAISKGMNVAYMPQEMLILSTKTVEEEALATFGTMYENMQEAKELEDKIHASAKPSAQDVERYAQLQHDIQEMEPEAKILKVNKLLSGLKFDEKHRKTRVDQLSVGWRMRLVLAKLLLQEADFYLFDEPTNHLDLSTKEWFLNFLKYETSFGFLLVCHDRYFLDNLCNKTLAITAGGKSKVYAGNYSYYKKLEAEETIMLEKAYEAQQRDIKQRKETIDRFKATASKAKMAQSMAKQLEKLEIIEVNQASKKVNFSLPPVERCGKEVLIVKNVAHSFNRQLFTNVNFVVNRGDKVALIAPNGTGKSTLFNLISKQLELQQGQIEQGHNVTSTLFDQDQEKVLNPKLTILEEVEGSCKASQQRIRTFLGSFLFPKGDVMKKTSVLSGGERNRVAMVKVLLSNANFLMLDEPTNHLDIESKETVLNALQQFDGTLLFVSHDQDFVNNLATRIIELTPEGISSYEGNYDAYLDFKNMSVRKEVAAVAKAQVKNVKESTLSKKELFELRKKYKNLENNMNKYKAELETVLANSYAAAFGSSEYTAAQEKKDVLEKRIAKAEQELAVFPHKDELEL